MVESAAVLTPPRACLAREATALGPELSWAQCPGVTHGTPSTLQVRRAAAALLRPAHAIVRVGCAAADGSGGPAASRTVAQRVHVVAPRARWDALLRLLESFAPGAGCRLQAATRSGRTPCVLQAATLCTRRRRRRPARDRLRRDETRRARHRCALQGHATLGGRAHGRPYAAGARGDRRRIPRGDGHAARGHRRRSQGPRRA